MSVWAVLVAAGRGERLGGDQPKAFARLAGRPLLAESLVRLDDCAALDGIVLVAPVGWEEAAILLAEELGVSKVSACVPGGATRSESVRIGVGEVPSEARYLLVHDAARPLLPEGLVERLLDALAGGHAGAVPGLPLTDTVKRVREGVVIETLERSELVAVQTPQAFVADRLRVALGEEASDCSALVEAAGGSIAVVRGDERLLKVTTGEDLRRVEGWLGATTTVSP